ncbi:helix-turn-helix transcriptional regulator [Eubacterium sp.]|uniref:helix-turn-helix transcriptional regulator n=1 Tax=uncultured Eubacterium sp. TaxID=165185 RepID=UPI0025FECDFE|nr:sigma factor-like helix-turn-helix DNA-binding protein [uncultured Eubacterium sp.]
MIDFINNYYYEDYSTVDGMDREKAKKKAFSAVLPLIMQEELTPMQSVCLRYRYENHKTQAEIANLLKLSQPTVSRHISSAKEKMNNSLGYCYIALSKAIDEYDRLANSLE